MSISSSPAVSTQDLSNTLLPQPHPRDSSHRFSVHTRRWCANTATLVREAQSGVRAATALPDGFGVRADQTPRFLSPNHAGQFGFNNFIVLGDHKTVTFERVDPFADNEDWITAETWRRTGTTVLAGRTASVFRPRWPSRKLREYLRRVRWGADYPYIVWGFLVLPQAPVDAEFGRVASEAAERIPVLLNMQLPGVPPTPVTKINETVQYSSHVVNLWIPGFGGSRVTGGDANLDLEMVTNTFYEHFKDEYEIVAVISQTHLLAQYGGFHRPVRNDIAGIGLELGDVSGMYGSASVLLGVEFYPSAQWTLNAVMLHETGHQWGEYSGVWDPLGGPEITSLGLDRRGHDPETHTPLLTPGAVTYGAVLEGERRVRRRGAASARGPASHGPRYVIERTMPLITYNPLTMYRMGHRSASGLPTYHVFADQGQFDPDDEGISTVPEVGADVDGDHYRVTGEDIVATDGPRSGPVVSRIRRAHVYVSRGGLATKSEMNMVNYLAARFGAREGVTSWDRYPSFFEATSGKVPMSTSIVPKGGSVTTGASDQSAKPTAVQIQPGPDVAYAPVPKRALIGMTFDEPIPGRVNAGDIIRLKGTLTAKARNDYHAVCFRFYRYGAADPDEVFECGSLRGDQFSVRVTFGSQQKGTYTLENFVFWPDSGPQYPLSWFGTIVVE